jgi:hypothetical protein
MLSIYEIFNYILIQFGFKNDYDDKEFDRKRRSAGRAKFGTGISEEKEKEVTQTFIHKVLALFLIPREIIVEEFDKEIFEKLNGRNSADDKKYLLKYYQKDSQNQFYKLNLGEGNLFEELSLIWNLFLLVNYHNFYDQTQKLGQTVISLQWVYEKVTGNLDMKGLKKKEFVWIITRRFLVPFLAKIIAQLDIYFGLAQYKVDGDYWFLPVVKNNGEIVYPVKRFFDWWIQVSGLSMREIREKYAKQLNREYDESIKSTFNNWNQSRSPGLDNIEKLSQIISNEEKTNFYDNLSIDEIRCLIKDKQIAESSLSADLMLEPSLIKEIMNEGKEWKRFEVRFINRYLPPDKAGIKSRLIFSKVIQNMFNECISYFGKDSALQLLDIFNKTADFIFYFGTDLMDTEKQLDPFLLQNLLWIYSNDYDEVVFDLTWQIQQDIDESIKGKDK